MKVPTSGVGCAGLAAILAVGIVAGALLAPFALIGLIIMSLAGGRRGPSNRQSKW